MATWAQMQTDLPPLFTALLGIPCDWRTQPRGMHTGARAQLDVIGGVGRGVDEPTWDDVPADDVADPPVAVRATVHGIREMTLQVSVWALRQTLDQSAREYLERLRLRLRFPSTVVALDALGLAVVGIERVVQIDPEADGRKQSEASMDVRIAYGVRESDTAIPYIETARIHDDGLGVDVTANLGS